MYDGLADIDNNNDRSDGSTNNDDDCGNEEQRLRRQTQQLRRGRDSTETLGMDKDEFGVATRDEMKTYWEEHSRDASEQEMMCDSNAEVLGKEEVPEIMSMLPDITGMDVLELGAGIGRFTGLLADRGAKSVLAVDFMESFTAKNRQLNGHRDNCSFLQADVIQLEFSHNRYDLVFASWMLIYLGETEVHALFTKLLAWLRPGGYFFFRESCYHHSGNWSRPNNPSHYRNPGVYNHSLLSVSQETDTEGDFAFEIIMSKSLQTYVKMKSNRNQICWLLHKVRRNVDENKGFKTFQEFLDNRQYTAQNIKCYEWIFGRNFNCPGGMETSKEFLKLLDLKPGQQVLDVGSGLGGNAFLMAQDYDVSVTGVDLSPNMVECANERANEIRDNRVQFEVANATKRQYRSESFDVIYSRDVILHIQDKLQLFKSFYRWLKPGGKLFITDYCIGVEDSTQSQTFESYVHERAYHLVPVSQYAELLEQVGFVQVRSEDRTKQLAEVTETELERLENNKDQFIQEMSLAQYEKFASNWRSKLTHCNNGDLHWGLFFAQKI